jgi:ribosomal protein S18 acetylase RimI-like enzyme
VELREYTIRLVGPSDEAQVQELFESDPDYFKIVKGAPARVADAQDLLSDLPEGKEYGDKFVYTIFDRDGGLAAVIDLVRDYPQYDTWFLGLLFVAPARRNMGFGSRLLDAIHVHVKQQGGHAIRLGVVRGNVRARALYDRTGFRFVDECKRTQANGFIVIIDVLERAL